MSDFVIAATNYCAYGCGREAQHSLKTKGGGWKFCCSPHYQQCPAQKKRRGAITRDAYVKQKMSGTIFRRGLLRQTKKEARQKSIPWTITDNHFYDLIQGLCYYCGQVPTGLQTPHAVVRYDSTLGFTPQNSIPCCHPCYSLTQSGWRPDEFWSHIKKILTRHPDGIVHPSKAIITKSA
jgi:hypothetical protein